MLSEVQISLDELPRPHVFTGYMTSTGRGSMLIVFILGTGTVFGILPGLLKLDKKLSIYNIVTGCVGATIGAFLGFGDAQLLHKYPFLNEITLMVAVSFLFVLTKVLVTRNRKVP